jgi:hypothetical protein
MTSTAEDDVLAEQQLQASLRRVAEQSVHSLLTENCEESIPALSNPGRHIECRPTQISLPRTPLSPKLAVYCSPKLFGRTTSLEGASNFQSATGNQSGIDFSPLKKDDAEDNVRDFRERNAPMSPHHAPAIEYETHPKALSGEMGVKWETRQHSDQDINMEDVSSSSPKLAQIRVETALTTANALPNVCIGKPSSTLTNPWSMFASPTNLNSFPKHTLSSDFRFGNRSLSTMATSQGGAEKIDGFKACPSWLNEDVAQSQRIGLLKLPHNRVESLTVHETTNDSSRGPQKPSTSSFEAASGIISSAKEGDLNVNDDKQNGFGGLHSRRMTLISGQDKSLEIKRLFKSQRETTGMKWKPIGTARETIPSPRDSELIVHEDKQNNFFGGLHPSRMTLISEQEAPPPKKMLLQSNWEATGSSLVQLSPLQDTVKVQKELKNNEHMQRSGAIICSSKRLFTGEHPKDETQLTIKGIESLKKRYNYLDPTFPLGKVWSFVLREIAAILRTPFAYEYSPHTPEQKGYAIQLKTDFKVFRLRGPFCKKLGKEMITKKAVLYVIGGLFFFKQAAPALNGE